MRAVISNMYPDGSEHPIAYSPRTFTATEWNYAQLEKEACSLVFGIRKFHQCLYGCKFTLYTDHKPLTAILGPKKGVPTLAAARLQRWALILSAYDYDIVFKPTLTLMVCPGCLWLLAVLWKRLEGISVFNIGQVQSLPVTAVQLRHATLRNLVLSQVLRYTRDGWSRSVPDELKPYWIQRSEFSIESDCLM